MKCVVISVDVDDTYLRPELSEINYLKYSHEIEKLKVYRCNQKVKRGKNYSSIHTQDLSHIN
jgi:hypothetical protein